ncbi:PREDICTED: uncharacterized protein LOC109484793 [Branchiostoma belcheri]|uniref:Uncharacterized protein LOC109484793 n=1 Tax=Branchiostoma belcheri TaxID=7741 RepID=A0A6P4ZR87_BRABE|nr:PREDICTED: uncharacterized protein LOC109484793 [Branchiostoma belcheri]
MSTILKYVTVLCLVLYLAEAAHFVNYVQPPPKKDLYELYLEVGHCETMFYYDEENQAGTPVRMTGFEQFSILSKGLSWRKYIESVAKSAAMKVGPRAASCSEMKSLNPAAGDGEYTLYPFPMDNDVSIRVYCHDMASGNPKEFLSLPAGPDENYAIISPDKLSWEYGCTGSLQSPYIEAGTTKFSKLRITLEESRVEVIRDDYTFARTTGPNAIPYGHAGDCYSRVQGCARGTFKVDLTGTELSLAPDTHWKLSERYPASLTVHGMFFSEDRKVASAFCGGWCGHCWPVGDKLYLAYPIRSGSCPHPPVITGATLSGCDYPYEENEVCTYSCDSGYFWEGGDRSRACRGGNWEGSALVCSNQSAGQELEAAPTDPADWTLTQYRY